MKAPLINIPVAEGVGVLRGLVWLLRLTGSSSSPREKNWPLLELILAAVTVAGDPKLSRSELEPPVFSSCFSTAKLLSTAAVRLSCDVREDKDSLEPDPSLLKAE